MVTPGSSSQKNYLLLTPKKPPKWGSALCFKAALSQKDSYVVGGGPLLWVLPPAGSPLPLELLKVIHLEWETLSCMCNTQPPPTCERADFYTSSNRNF